MNHLEPCHPSWQENGGSVKQNQLPVQEWKTPPLHIEISDRNLAVKYWATPIARKGMGTWAVGQGGIDQRLGVGVVSKTLLHTRPVGVLPSFGWGGAFIES